MKKLFPPLNLHLLDWIGILVCSIPAFYLLGSPAIYIWDEAVYVNASLDMSNGSSLWVPVHGEYNTKPPLVLWLQALFLQCIPSAEWAVRLPSALSVTGILLLFQMGLKRWGFDFWSRFLVMVCFVGHEGFIRHHISRTGDLDAVMTFFVVAYVMVLLDAIHHNRWNNKHLFWFFLTFVCAFYSKSVGGWLMIAPLGLIWLLSPLRKVLFTLRLWYVAFLSGLLCLFYYVTREMVQPGFLDLVFHSEYQRMFRNVMPWHEHGASYYFINFSFLKTFTPWNYLLALAIVYALILVRDRLVRRHLLQWIILGLGYMLVITIPAVKLEWYDAPAFPFFALITGVVTGLLATKIPGRWKVLILIPALFVLGRKLMYVRGDINPRHPFEYEGAILRNAAIDSTTKVFMKVQVPEHRLQLDFYAKVRFEQTGILVNVIDTISQVENGDRIIISQQDQLSLIQDHFALDTLNVFPGLGYEVKVGLAKPNAE